MTDILECAIEAAKAAGDIIANGAQQRDSLQVEEKSSFDYVSRIDRESEAAIRRKIEAAFPDHAILGEELGAVPGDHCSDWQWVIDPLDGTTNFLRGIPHYAVSIAVLHRGSIEVGVVFDVAKNELFVARRGQGAYLNDNPMPRLADTSFAGSLLATGVPFSGVNLAELDAFTGTMEDLLAVGTSGVRRLGSAALDLAYVAAGRYDGFWEANLKLWDIAAGVLIAQECGLVVTDFSGNKDFLLSGDIVAAVPSVHAEMVGVTRRHYQR